MARWIDAATKERLIDEGRLDDLRMIEDSRGSNAMNFNASAAFLIYNIEQLEIKAAFLNDNSEDDVEAAPGFPTYTRSNAFSAPVFKAA